MSTVCVDKRQRIRIQVFNWADRARVITCRLPPPQITVLIPCFCAPGTLQVAALPDLSLRLHFTSSPAKS